MLLIPTFRRNMLLPPSGQKEYIQVQCRIGFGGSIMQVGCVLNTSLLNIVVILLVCRRRQHVSTKCCYPRTRLHGQNTEERILNKARSENLQYVNRDSCAITSSAPESDLIFTSSHHTLARQELTSQQQTPKFLICLFTLCSSFTWDYFRDINPVLSRAVVPRFPYSVAVCS